MKPTKRRARRGISALWLLLALPVMLMMLFTVTTVASLWLARTELEDACEAAALAGAKVWGDAGADTATTRSQAHLAAAALATSNTVLSNTFSVDANDNSGMTNNNAACPGAIVLGQVVGSAFRADRSPTSADERGAYVSLTVSVTTPWYGGGVIGPLTVTANAAAVYTSSNGQARLVTITSFTCP